MERIRPSKKRINIQNIDDNECCKWTLIRYLNPADHNSRRMTKADKEFSKKLGFKCMKCPVKIKDIHNIVKSNFIGISVFGCEDKEKISNLCIKKIL